MPAVEIDEAELTRLKGIEQVAAKVSAHPEGRKLLEEAVAKAMPERAAPEVRLRSEFGEFQKAIIDRLDADKAERQKETDERKAAEAKAELERRWFTGKDTLRKRGYTDEGIATVEKLMEDRGIADHEAAAALAEQLNPPPAPAMSGGTSWNFFDQKDEVSLKPLFEGSDDAFLGPAIGSALKEVRGR